MIDEREFFNKFDLIKEDFDNFWKIFYRVLVDYKDGQPVLILFSATYKAHLWYFKVKKAMSPYKVKIKVDPTFKIVLQGDHGNRRIS